MRGYADSEKPTNISDYNMDNMVEDIRELVKYLGVCALVAMTLQFLNEILNLF